MQNLVVLRLTLHLQGHNVCSGDFLTARLRLRRYVYLVDSQNRVRWSASGRAEPAEANAFIECTHELVEDRKHA
jgi:hypothetical protein